MALAHSSPAPFSALPLIWLQVMTRLVCFSLTCALVARKPISKFTSELFCSIGQGIRRCALKWASLSTLDRNLTRHSEGRYQVSFSEDLILS